MSTTLHFAVQSSTLVHILVLGFCGFLFAMALTPLYTTIAYKKEWWKKPRTEAWSGGVATVYNKLHAAKHSRHIPNMAGLIFVLAITIVTVFGNLSRGQT